MSISLGGNKIKDIYIGSSKIKEAYLGSSKVYIGNPIWNMGLLGFYDFTKGQMVNGNVTATAGNLNFVSSDATSSTTVFGTGKKGKSIATSNSTATGGFWADQHIYHVNGGTTNLWFSATTTGTVRIFSGNNQNYIVFTTTTNSLSICNGNMTNNVTIALTISAWNMFTVSLDATTKELKVYVNGVLVHTKANATTVTEQQPIHMLATGTSWTSFTGVINQSYSLYSRWNRVLSATEITYLYNSGNGRDYGT